MKAYHGTFVKFSKFDRRFTCDMGFHFGSYDTARHRLENVSRSFGETNEWNSLECELDILNSIHMPDAVDWSDHKLVAEILLETQTDKVLLGIAEQYLDEPYNFSGEIDAYERMREDLLAAGYDSIRYENTAEGGGESILVFEEDAITIKEIE